MPQGASSPTGWSGTSPPTVANIPAGWDPLPPVVEGGNGYGTIEYGYVGPDPPNKQTYRLKLYAVDTMIDLPRGTNKVTLGETMRGHIVEQTQLTAWYDFHSVAHDSIEN